MQRVSPVSGELLPKTQCDAAILPEPERVGGVAWAGLLRVVSAGGAVAPLCVPSL